MTAVPALSGTRGFPGVGISVLKLGKSQANQDQFVTLEGCLD